MSFAVSGEGFVSSWKGFLEVTWVSGLWRFPLFNCLCTLQRCEDGWLLSRHNIDTVRWLSRHKPLYVIDCDRPCSAWMIAGVTSQIRRKLVYKGEKMIKSKLFIFFFIYIENSRKESIASPQHPFPLSSELEDMLDGTVARSIHCGSFGFILSSVCGRRHRRGRCGTKAYNRLLQRHLEDTDSSVRQGACGQVSGHNGLLTEPHVNAQSHKQKTGRRKKMHTPAKSTPCFHCVAVG